MATRSLTGDDKPSPMSIRFTAENYQALSTASTLTGSSINSIVNEAVASHLASPAQVSGLRSAYAAFASNTSTLEATINRLAGEGGD